jgi:mannose-6-phosphate isomerase class I
VLDRWKLDGDHAIPNDDRFHFLAVVEGSIAVTSNSNLEALRRGDTILIPASSRGAEIQAEGNPTVLDMYLP